jgi:HlyD family secretion protein
VLRISNDALRFRPRDAAAPSQPQPGSAQAAERGERLIEQMKTALKLSDAQVDIVRDLMRKGAAARAERQKAREAQGEARGETRSDDGAPAAANGAGPRGGGGPGGDARNRFMERIEAALEPTLTAEQKPLLERWRQVRQTGRTASVWILGPDRRPEQRQVRLGIGDDQFAELLGGLREGDQVITRQRQAAKR